MHPSRITSTPLTAAPSPTRIQLAIAGGMLLLAIVATVFISPAVAHAGGGISSGGSGGGSGSGKEISPSSIKGVSKEYAKFTAILASNTGLSPRVIAGWTLAEGGPKDNPLNMGPGNHYGTVRKGAKATEQNLQSDLYKGIMRSVKRADMSQIDAIVASPWCPGCHGYKRLLKSTYSRVSVDG